MKKFTVSEFIDFLNAALTAAVFPDGVVIEGEIAEYRVSQGKWIWFLLKDEQSVMSCFSMTWKLRQPLEDGLQVRVFGVPKVHPRSGKFSLNVERVEPVGEGALRRSYELLKASLQKEGLFDRARKRAVPRFPTRIGLIASRESAAYSDFLRILGNRWGSVEVNSLHVQVQGQEAVESIVSAFDYFNQHPELADVLVLTRGGGSMEDLHAFNSEDVARAVFGARLPVVVGVGHERDESLADFVADVRASTPSNAAEIVVPDRAEFLTELNAGVGRLASCMDEVVARRLSRVNQARQQIENRVTSILSTFQDRWRDFVDAFNIFSAKLQGQQERQAEIKERLVGVTGRWLANLARDLDNKDRMLATLDPQNVLRRGYAIVRRGGRTLKTTAIVTVGEPIDVQLHRGNLTAEVTKVKK